MAAQIFEHIWMFVRDDLNVADFEEWVYAHNEGLKKFMGEEFQLEIISINYKSKSEVYELKQNLEKRLRELNSMDCECISLSNTNVTDMGSEREDRVFKTLHEIKAHGEPCWWLALYKCSNCEQYWLIAQETEQNDVHCFKRLSQTQANKIIKEGKWPDSFKIYEELISLEKERSVRHFC